MKRYKAHLPGDFYGMHIYAESLQDARTQLRESLEVRRLPAGTSVYESPIGSEYWETRSSRESYPFMD